MNSSLLSRKIAFFVICFLLVFASHKPSISGIDSKARYHQIASWFGDLEEGVELDQRYSIAQPVLAVPLYTLGKITEGNRDPQGAKKHRIALVSQFNHLVLFVFLIWLYRWLLHGAQLKVSQVEEVILALLLFSFFLPHSTDFYTEILWSTSLFYSIVKGQDYLAGRSISWVLLIAATFIAGWASPVALIILSLAVAPPLLWQWKKEGVARGHIPLILSYGLGCMLAVVFFAGENYLEQGEFFRSGYSGEQFGAFNFSLLGYLGLLISPGRGMLFFAPGFFLFFYFISKELRPHFGEIEREAIISLWLAGAATWLAFASWNYWGGAGYWGPRFLMLPSILGAYFLARLWHLRAYLSPQAKAMLMFLLGISFYVIRFGATYAQHFHHLCAPRRSVEGMVNCHFTWYESPFYLFTQDAAGWIDFFLHRANVTLVICGVMFLGFRRYYSRE